VQQLTPLVSGDLQFALSHGLVPASCADFSLALDIRQTTPGGIKSVTCPTHPECEVLLGLSSHHRPSFHAVRLPTKSA
jgi:hypothetical protein